MSEIPGDLKFLKSHEWARVEGDGKVTVGISDHAQGLLGDLVYVELPNVGDHVEVGTACAVVESVKAASDIYPPVSGTVTEVNGALADKPMPNSWRTTTTDASSSREPAKPVAAAPASSPTRVFFRANPAQSALCVAIRGGPRRRPCGICCGENLASRPPPAFGAVHGRGPPAFAKHTRNTP